LRISVVIALTIVFASCKPEGPSLLLQGDKPTPVIRTAGLANDLFIVISVVPYGYQNMLGLVVAEDGTHERATFISPTATGLKRGDVIRASQICFRSDERPEPSVPHRMTDTCTDVVMPYVVPTPEAPQPPAPVIAPAPEVQQPQAPPNPQ
jgi:hypothetical protein